MSKCFGKSNRDIEVKQDLIKLRPRLGRFTGSELWAS